MMTYMRTIIEVPDEIIESLDRVGDSENRSRAALIREAIADFLRQKSVPPAQAAFGVWKANRQDGVKYQNQLRAEWDVR